MTALMLFTSAKPITCPAVSVGEKTPAFTVYAGKKKALDSTALLGKITILTYESRNTVNKNKFFKDQILKAFSEHSQKQSPVTVIAVISCFEYLWPINRRCISAIQKNAGKLGMNLYDDRTGEMLNNLNLKKDESYILIIDSQGIVRYVYSGIISENETAEVIKLIYSLCGKNLLPEQNSLPGQ